MKFKKILLGSSILSTLLLINVGAITTQQKNNYPTEVKVMNKISEHDHKIMDLKILTDTTAVFGTENIESSQLSIIYIKELTHYTSGQQFLIPNEYNDLNIINLNAHTYYEAKLGTIHEDDGFIHYTNSVRFKTTKFEEDEWINDYDLSATYNEGDRVKYNGIFWIAKNWIVAGNEPRFDEPSGVDSGWRIDTTDNDILPWLMYGTYSVNDLVAFKGKLYIANFAIDNSILDPSIDNRNWSEVQT